VKAHYRIVNGKVVYIPNYDRAVNGDHPEATTHQRTVIGVNSHGVPFIRATDSEDRDKVLAVASSLGIRPNASRQSGTGTAGHHGRAGSYPHIYFDTSSQAHDVMDAFRVQHGDRGHEHTRAESPRRGAGAIQAAMQRMATATRANTAAVTAAQARQDAQETAESNQNRRFFRTPAGTLDRRVVLENTTPGHNKQYIIDLRQVGEGKWVVNVGNGRIDGRTLTVRTKTDRPMSQAAANILVSQIKAEKTQGGYVSVEDSADPTRRYTAMDDFLHPSVNTPGRGAQAPAPASASTGTSTPAIARPAATAAPASPAGAPMVTARQYEALRQAAFDAGTIAGNSFTGAMAAYNAHMAALPAARAVNASETARSGAGWHQRRADHWLQQARNSWTQLVAGVVGRNGVLGVSDSGTGFANAITGLQNARTALSQRPPGAALPTGATEDEFRAASANIDDTIASLEHGKKIEALTTAAGNAPASETIAHAALVANYLQTLASRVAAPHQEAAQRISGAFNSTRVAASAANSMINQTDSSPEELSAAADTLKTMVANTKAAMNAAPEGMLWRKAPTKMVEMLGKVAERAEREATRRANMPKTADSRFADTYERHRDAAITAHAIAIGSQSPDRAKRIAALDAHKKAAVSTYHAALQHPKGSAERKDLMAKAHQHAEHAKSFVTLLNQRS
jgi:hypothetical protein